MISSGPKTPRKVRLKFLNKAFFILSDGPGMFKCIADQTQRPRVKTHKMISEAVPRPLGFATEPTVEALLQFVCEIRTDPPAERTDTCRQTSCCHRGQAGHHRLY